MAEEQQSNIRQENNVARTGMNMDQSLNQIQQGQLTYALNAAVENFDSNSVNYQNEPGNELCLNFPEGYVLIGKHNIVEQSKHVFFLTNPDTGASEIGYMDNNDCIYHTYVSGACLNFNIDYPIHKAVHKITNCTTEIYWTDGLNPRRYLNIEDVTSAYKIQPGTNVCDNKTIKELDCNKLKVQPNFTIPELTVVDVVNGGSLIAGTYQFAIQYCDAAGDAYTSYYSVTNPTPIAITTITTPDFNYPVGRSIVLNITNIDVTGYFTYYNVAVIKTVNDITSVELVGTYFIDDNFNQITYSGQNQTQIRLTINDVFEKFPYYEIAQDLTAVQDVLVWDNITSIDRINYQKIANQISLNWISYKLPASENYADPINATNLRGYLRDEVYAFEIVFLLNNGKQTDGFHIPGRTKNYNEIQPEVQNTNPDFIGDGTSAPYWKIYNTASVTGPASGPNIGNATPYQYGQFAYWESTDVYPCNTEVWGDLANTPIRHHKFPDVLVSPIFESGTPTVAYNGTYTNLEMKDAATYPIGVYLDVQQVYQLIDSSGLTQDQKESIVGFKIVRGNRSTNTSIVAKGILRNLGEYEREGTSYYFPNYPYNDLRVDPFLLKENNAFDAVCREYKVTITTAGKLNSTSCDTGLTEVQDVTIGQIVDICSASFPTFSDSAAGIITAANYGTYELCTNAYAAGNRFSYFPPTASEPTVIWVAGNTYDPWNPNCKTVNSITKPIQVDGSGRYTITLLSENTGTKNCTTSIDQLDAFNNTKSPYRFVFNSPETSFGKPFLGNILKLENAIYGGGHAHFVQVQKNAMYKLITKEAQEDALKSSEKIAGITNPFSPTAMFTAYQAYLQIYINGITRKNYARSYNSIAKYNYWAPINNNLGVKQRELDLCQYLIPGVQNVGDDLNINNFNRESSVYLKTIDNRDTFSVSSLPYPSNTPSLLIGGTIPAIEDKSRFTISEKANCLKPENEFDISTVTYYASIKNIANNQWGQMYSYETIDTGFQNLLIEKAYAGIVFGGDTFINKFSFKTKLPFFIDNRVGAPDDSDVFYDEIGNVAYPKYWHSSRSILSNYTTTVTSGSPALPTTMQNIVSIKAHNFDCPNSQSEGSSGRTFYDGSFYLFAYGIPTFYCETAVNVDLRQAFNNREGDFFPHVSTGIPDNWFQESYVPISQDNTYYYNTTFSKQNKENYFSHLPIDWDGNQCYTNFPFRAIYSDRQQSFTDNRINSWLIYRPISFFDFPQNYGDLVSLDGIQNRAVLARFENKSLLYNTLLTVETSNPQAAYLGNDTLFRSAPPIDFAETDLGYVGSQNKMLLKIPQGQITVDAKRGQVFLIAGNQAQDLSAFGSGLNRFFTDHLAFEILRYFPDVNTDNHFNGVGLHGVYDSKYDRVIITKLDYIPLTNNVKYDSAKQDFYVERVLNGETFKTIINLTDREYFCNKSWTLSFNLNTKSWVSFHSYLPNFYIGENNFFYSGLNEGCGLDVVAVTEPNCEFTVTGTEIYCDFEATANEYVPTIPVCTGKTLVFQVCNSNAVTDDNFEVYLNNEYIGYLDLNANAQVGSVFIASLNPSLTITQPDFACPLSLIETYRFDPAILQASNTIEMRNTEINYNGNYGQIGVRNYEVSGTNLINPCQVDNFIYSGGNGASFSFIFNYQECCPTRPSFVEVDVTTSNASKVVYFAFESSINQTFTINWGDGSPVQTVNNNALSLYHTYATAGDYTIYATMSNRLGLVSFEVLFDLYTDTNVSINDIRNLGDLDTINLCSLSHINFNIEDVEFPANLTSLRLRYSRTPNIDLRTLYLLQYLYISNDSVVTSINLSGLSFLQNLEVVLLSALTSVDTSGIYYMKSFFIDQCVSFTVPPSLFAMFYIITIRMSNTSLSSISLSEIPDKEFLTSVQLFNCQLDETSVNNILITLDNAGLSNGNCNVSGGTNATPSGLGLVAKSNLITKGWTVTTN